ncbi:MAG: ATP-binding protein [Candidatus Omnitrophica bacterium]|nr:ATP-binding protein [Candidatus Omnitrophota bacterium]
MEKEFHLTSNSDQLKPFREQLELALHEIGLYEKGAGEVVLAMDEALTNIIRHAYDGKSGKIDIVLRDFQDRIEIEVRNFGKKFDPSKIPPPELPPKKPGGLGLYLIKKLTDKSEYSTPEEGENRLLLTKYKK